MSTNNRANPSPTPAAARAPGKDGFFYAERDRFTRPSAEAIVPILTSLCRPRSVVDVGCGIGTWLSVFKQHAVERILGIDAGSTPREHLRIAPTEFRPVDLQAPFRLEERFDLAISLEVAEHLPAASAAGFVQSLVEAAPVVAFSAAIPGQGGHQHINEQWPEYWVDLFRARGYQVMDAVRPAVWSNENVLVWYAQNTLVFAAESTIAASPALADARRATDERRLSMVHPRLFHFAARDKTPPLKWLLSQLPRATRNTIARRMKKNGAQR